MVREDSPGSAGVEGTGAGGGVWVRVGKSAPIPLPRARRGCSGLCMVEDLFGRSEEHTSELQSPCNLVCRLLLEKKNASRLDPALVQFCSTRDAAGHAAHTR